MDDTDNRPFPASRRWHKTRQPNPEMQAGIDARLRHHLSHAQIQIARGLAMNPKKLGEVDKY
jgi:hypothetical protein